MEAPKVLTVHIKMDEHYITSSTGFMKSGFESQCGGSVFFVHVLSLISFSEEDECEWNL